MKLCKQLTIVLLLLLSNQYLVIAQQTTTVAGSVTDVAGKALPFVSVSVKGTTIGINTDDDGKYSISVPKDVNILVFSFVGFTTVEQEIAGRSVVNITMQPESTSLDEVVVIGYGTQRKSDLTGGITSISAENLERIPSTNIAQRLQGQVAGLTVSNTNDKPGETSTLRVRGEKSLSAGNNPLIILDGIPFGGALTEVDQNSIANISVLRDASSAAIYGSRAANGVILITTKKGKMGKPIVRYNGYVGIQYAERLPDVMDGEEWTQLIKDYKRDNNTQNPNLDKDWADPLKWPIHTAIKDNFLKGKETDWLKETFRTALMQEHQVSLSGATESTNYYASVSYLDQDGIVKYTGYKKYAVTANLNQKLGSWLQVGTNIMLSERDRGGETPNHAYAYRMSPYASVRDEKGEYIRYPMDPEVLYFSPFANIDRVYDDKSRAAYLNGFAEVKLPLKGLTYRANLGYSYRHRLRGSYYGRTTKTGSETDGSAQINNDSYGDWTWENILRYENDWGKHHLDLTGLYSAQETWYEGSEMSGEGFLSDDNAYHNIDMAQKNKRIASDESRTALISYMGRINYSYDKRYMLTLTIRRDGYSAFGPNNKWAVFPSIAGAWSISEEPIFKNWALTKIDFLKLRMSYGANGNQDISAYRALTKLTQQDYIYGNEAEFAGGLATGFTAGNPNLRWETTKSFNTGLDFAFFGNRLSGSFDYYLSKTKDLLMSRTIPVMNGYTSMIDNVGRTQNTGFEFSLTSANIQSTDFQWNTTTVFAGNWSKITALREDGKDDIANKWFIGQPVRVHYDYKVIGIWQTADKDEATKYKSVPGDAKLWDKNGDGSISATATADDRTVIGSMLPVWTLGLTNTFTYKNWSLSIFLNGVFDVTKENETVKFERQLLAKQLNYIRGVDYWTPERPSNKYTRPAYNKTHGFYTDASFVRIQDVNLAYTFPKSIVNKIGIQGLTAYINGRNLYTFSKAYKYTSNIEQEKYSLDGAGYPTASVFILGANITF